MDNYSAQGRQGEKPLLPSLDNIPKEEMIEVDFEGVHTFAPSWGDEFFSALSDRFEKLIFINTAGNPSVEISLEVLEELEGLNFEVKS